MVSVEGLDFEVDGMLKQRQVEARSNPFDLSWIHIYYQGRFFAGQGARGFVRLRNRIPARFLENSSVYIDDPTLGLRGMLSSIAHQLNLNAKFFKWQLVPELKAAIEKNFADYHKTTLLIIDDAQHLKPQALDELRLLTNFHIDSKAPLSLILLAQPEFRKLVQLQALEAFRQRLTLRVHLTGLAQSEAAAYVKHQLEIAGRTDTLFTDDVIAEIYQQAKGIPRLINTLCYECLLDIYRQQKNVVDLPTLEKVLCQYENW
ncbi:MAG: AAA family ATPase [candidate division KSB1 bacterium]|nr:AAA family ATPase [candidate division KSB1 bacterium]